MDSHVPKTDFKLHMLKEFCTAVAKGIKVQCAREYWGDPELRPRAMEIFKLTKEELKSLPTENLETERYLAKFGYLTSQSAARSNKFLMAQRI